MEYNIERKKEDKKGSLNIRKFRLLDLWLKIFYLLKTGPVGKESSNPRRFVCG